MKNNRINLNFFAGIALAALVVFCPPALAQQSVTAPAGSDGTSSVAKVTAPSPDGGTTATDPALQAFQNMSAEDRNALLQQAVETFRNMTPEERQGLAAQAKAMGGDASDFGAQWGKLLSPDQKQMLSQQLDPLVKTVPAQTAPPASDDPVGSLMQQIQNLTPAQRQRLMDGLKAPGTGATPAATAATPPAAAAAPADPCEGYQSINPAFYASCEKRMHPAQK